MHILIQFRVDNRYTIASFLSRSLIVPISVQYGVAGNTRMTMKPPGNVQFRNGLGEIDWGAELLSR